MTIWDTYGNWSDIAKLREVEIVKKLIKGNNNVWRPNFCSAPIQYIFEYAADEVKSKIGTDPTAVDFGCGLGRNGPLLRRFFPVVIGLDLPEMISRLNSELPALSGSIYDRLYDSVSMLTENETPCLLYDSVVFQHIVDKEYVSNLIDLISSKSSLRIFVSIYNSGVNSPHLEALREKGWRVWHTELENLSFESVPHHATVFRRG
jgi:trans-aconitate methyltransferase